MADRGQVLFALEPDYRERVWGGQRLRAGQPPIGEAWVAFDGSVIRAGRQAGRRVGDLVGELGPALLGTAVFDRFGPRFPLLVKLLDCHDWLSVQVHPDDEQAARLVGPGHFGKTEAWYVLEAEPGATILAGVREGTSAEQLLAAIRGERVLEVAEAMPVASGQAVLVPAGMLHALGPGLLLYEVQQNSDTTYRVYDWGRPASPNRRLHIDESAEVTTTYRSPAPADVPEPPAGGGVVPVLHSEYFDLELLGVTAGGLDAATGGRSFHILTAGSGRVELRAGDETVRLERFETALVAAGAGRYELVAIDGEAAVLRSSVPAG